MTMQFRVVHTTRIAYDGGVAASYNEARMTPLTSGQQVVVHTRLDVQPTPWSQTYRDYWGTEVTAFEVLDQHSELTVTATSTVQVNRPPQEPGGADLGRGPRSPEVLDRFCETLRGRRPGAARRRAAALADGAGRRHSDGPSDFAREGVPLVYDEMKYQSGSTKVHGHASDAWAARTGVCQDMAHVAIGVLRAARVPARYVSGYLHPQVASRRSARRSRGSRTRGSSGGTATLGRLRPDQRHRPGDRHVVVARGRDYTDVPPLTGIFSGGSTSSMAVRRPGHPALLKRVS